MLPPLREIVLHPLDALVRKLSSHLALSDVDCASILALPFTLRTLQPSSYLVREGEWPDRCGVIVAGFAFRHKLLEDGSRQIVSLHVPGDPLDFQGLFLDVADHNVQTLTRAEIAFIPRERLHDLMATNPRARLAINTNVAIEASIFREWIVNVGRRDAPARLAHLLCELAARLNIVGLADDYAFSLPMTQEQLGDALGLTAVHVNRTLKALETAGLIRRDRRAVSVIDWRGLQDASGFHGRYLHLDRQSGGAASRNRPRQSDH